MLSDAISDFFAMEWAFGESAASKHPQEDAVIEILRRFGNCQDLDFSSMSQSPISVQIREKMARGEKLQFILPAFPAKSPNSEKTLGTLPDMGEVVSLQRLQSFCESVRRLYGPGAEVVICSDGRVFSDLVLVNDEDLMNYQNGISQIIEEFELDCLKTYSLENFYSTQNFSAEQMRESLVSQFSESVISLREKILGSQEMNRMFNGIHRFISEDRKVLFPERSRQSISKESKQVAYQVVRRSRAWDQLLNVVFPNTLRLSIHPYTITHHKFGIRLLPGKDRWGTPWHNVTLKTNDEYILVKRCEALDLGAKVQFFKGRYAYFEV